MLVTYILVVENNPVHARLIRNAFARATEWKTQLALVVDGQAAVDYLLSDHAKPDLIILELDLPKRNGLEVLGVIRSSSVYDHVPVIIFNASPEDLTQSKIRQTNLAATYYITKPLENKSYSTLARVFRECYETAQSSVALKAFNEF